jgi:hypothetical protein
MCVYIFSFLCVYVGEQPRCSLLSVKDDCLTFSDRCEVDPLSSQFLCKIKGSIFRDSLHCAPTLYYMILYCTTLHCTTLHCITRHYATLYYTILYYTILYYPILYYTILFYTILYYTILYYTAHHSTTPNCTALHSDH